MSVFHIISSNKVCESCVYDTTMRGAIIASPQFLQSAVHDEGVVQGVHTRLSLDAHVAQVAKYQVQVQDSLLTPQQDLCHAVGAQHHELQHFPKTAVFVMESFH